MDRFIPSRSALDMDVASFNLLKENSTSGTTSPTKVNLAQEAFCPVNFRENLTH